MKEWMRFVSFAAFVGLLVPQSAAQLVPIWESSVADQDEPVWLENGFHRGIAFGTVDGQDLVFVAGRESGGLIRVLDASTGEVVDTLDNTGITGGTFVINDVEVSDDGVIFACNMTIDAQADAFKVYRWDGIEAEPQLVIQYQPSSPGTRLGDKCTVAGAASDNTLTVYAAAPTNPESGITSVILFRTSDQGQTFTSTVLELQWLWVESTPSVAPVAPGAPFYFNSIETPIVLIDADGSVIDEVHARALDGSWRNNAIRHITAGEKSYLAVYDYEIPGVRMVDVTEGARAARRIGETESLSTPGGPMPLFGQGDLDYRLLQDGSFEIFVLATDVGIAAYRSAPHVALTPETIAFGDAFVTGTRSISLRIQNTGLEILEVSDIDFDAAAPFSIADTTPFNLAPGEEASLMVTFQPDVVDEYSGVLRLTTNDPDQLVVEVPISGTALLPPAIVVDAPPIEADLFSGQTTSSTIRISNEGFSDLTYSVRSREIAPESASKRAITFANVATTSLVPKRKPAASSSQGALVRPTLRVDDKAFEVPPVRRRYTQAKSTRQNGEFFFAYDFWSGEIFRLDLATGNQLGSFPIPPDGEPYIGGMAFDGTYLYVAQQESVQAIIKQLDALSGQEIDRMVVGDWVSGLTHDGDHLYVMTDGPSGSRLQMVDFGAKVVVRSIPVGSYVRLANVGVRGSFFSYDFAEARMIEIDRETGDLIQVLDLSYDFSDFSYSSSLNLLFFTNPQEEIFSVDLQSGDIVHRYPANASLIAMNEVGGMRWFRPMPFSGVIEAGEYVDVELVFDASGLDGGRYEGEVEIVSNDPQNPSTSFAVILDVTGAADIHVAQETLDFGTVFVGWPQTMSLVIENNGSVPLEISSMTSDEAAFSVDAEFPITVATRDHVAVNLVLAASDSLEYEGTLTLATNDPDEPQISVSLRGTGLFAPQLTLGAAANGLTFDASDVSEQSVWIGNSGLSDLSYSLAVHTDGVEAGVYTWNDSDSESGPRFNWISAASGSTLSLGDDVVVHNVPIGFEFDFYGTTVTHVAVSSNGWMSTGNPFHPFVHEIPSGDPHTFGAVVPFAADLLPEAGGSVRYQTFGEAPRRHFVLEFNQVPFYPGEGPNTFETILSEGSNAIKFQYQAISRPPDVVGIQSPDGASGFGTNAEGDNFIDRFRIRDGYAIEIRTSPLWLSADPEGGIIPPGDSTEIMLRASATGLERGSYEAVLMLSSNDPAQVSISIPVTLTVTVSTEQTATLPAAFALHPNYPNPFNPTTVIPFDLPANSHVRLRIFDILGREVVQLLDGEMPAGRHEIRWDSGGLASGTYLFRIDAGEFAQTRQLVLLR